MAVSFEWFQELTERLPPPFTLEARVKICRSLSGRTLHTPKRTHAAEHPIVGWPDLDLVPSNEASQEAFVRV